MLLNDTNHLALNRDVLVVENLPEFLKFKAKFKKKIHATKVLALEQTAISMSRGFKMKSS